MKLQSAFLFCFTVLSLTSASGDSLGTSFTYQGRLVEGGQPAKGSYDFRFIVYNAAVGGAQAGVGLTNSSVAVADGIFTAPLDFGANVFVGEARWLEIGVRTNGGSLFFTLSPRQPLTPAPQALYAVSAANAQLFNGQPSEAFALATGLANYVARSGDMMTGTLYLPANGLVAGGNLLVLSAGNVGIGTTAPAAKLDVAETMAARGLKVGTNHILSGLYATISGGERNEAGGDGAVVGGGRHNTSSESVTVVGGGEANTSSKPGATVGGGIDNASSGWCATVAGGGENICSGSYAAVGGGVRNTSSIDWATVAGGYENTSSGYNATVGGGQGNISSARRATVGGGLLNSSRGEGATVGGGYYNTNSGLTATIGGGDSNQATNHNATVGGGNLNTAGGDTATVGGGAGNRALGGWATVPGGRFNTAAGDYSLAAGYRAKANHDGAFVLADSQDRDLLSETENEFLGRFTGGVRFWTSLSAGVRVWPGATSWSAMCDRDIKENFQPVDAQLVLQRLADLPVQTWNLKAQDSNIRHIGPVAQDFRAAFGVGEDDKHISTTDADGVALVAIQGLNQKLEDAVKQKDARIAALERNLAELQTLVNALARRVDQSGAD